MILWGKSSNLSWIKHTLHCNDTEIDPKDFVTIAKLRDGTAKNNYFNHVDCLGQHLSPHRTLLVAKGSVRKVWEGSKHVSDGLMRTYLVMKSCVMGMNICPWSMRGWDVALLWATHVTVLQLAIVRESFNMEPTNSMLTGWPNKVQMYFRNVAF